MRVLVLALLASWWVILPALGQSVVHVPADREVGAVQLFDGSGNPIGPSNPLAFSGGDTRAVDQSLNAATLNAAYQVTGAGGMVGFSVQGLTLSTATLTVECSNNPSGATPLWEACAADHGGTWSSTLTADGNYRLAMGGRGAVRLRVSSTGTGVITIGSVLSPASQAVILTAGNAVVGSVKLDDGSGTAITSTSSALDVNIKSSAVGGSTTNVTQLNSTTISTNNGTADAGTERVAIASNNSPVAGLGAGATGSAVPANGIYVGGQASGNLTGKIQCDKSVVYDASTSGRTKLISKVTSQKIYLCGYVFFAAGTVNVDLDYGTQTTNPCDTGTTKLTPAYQLTAQTGISDNAGEFRGMGTAATQDICINASGGVAVQATVYYTQF